MVCGCGIPFIELAGTVEDWLSIRERAEKLREFDLEWWIDELIPILDQLVETARGNQDVSFWKSICNLYGGSGIRSPITGWIQAFFPYTISYGSGGRGGRGGEILCDQLEKNKYIGHWRKSIESNDFSLERGFGNGEGCGSGVDLKNIPSGISTAPFDYVDMISGKTYKMTFNGGLVAIVQDENKVIEPKFGWAVLDLENKE